MVPAHATTIQMEIVQSTINRRMDHRLKTISSKITAMDQTKLKNCKYNRIPFFMQKIK